MPTAKLIFQEIIENTSSHAAAADTDTAVQSKEKPSYIYTIQKPQQNFVYSLE